MRSKWWVAIGVAFLMELFAAGLLFRDASVFLIGALLVPLHAAAAALLALSVQRLLPENYRASGLGGALFLFTVAFYAPVLGTLGLFGMLLMLRRPRSEELPPWLSVDIPELPYRPFLVSPAPPGDGALLSLLRHAQNPEKRLVAAMTLRHMDSAEAVSILRVGLKDPVDEVRLLAYSMLDQREQVINARIKDLLTRLETAPRERHLALHRELAYKYWDLSYLGLSRGEVEAYVLSAARKHAEAILAEHPTEREMHLLLGRIHLRQRDPRAALSALSKAVALGIARDKVLPYLAEVAFLLGDYAAVRQHLSQVAPLSVKAQPALFQVASYWQAVKHGA